MDTTEYMKQLHRRYDTTQRLKELSISQAFEEKGEKILPLLKKGIETLRPQRCAKRDGTEWRSFYSLARTPITLPMNCLFS